MTIPNTPAFGSVAATVTGTITVPWGSGFTVTASGVGAASLPTGDPAAQYEPDIAAVAGMATVSVTEGASPHYSHARFACIDYRILYQSEPTQTQQYDQCAARYDVVIGEPLRPTAMDAWKSRNPTVKYFQYDLVWCVMQGHSDSFINATDMETWLTANGYTVEDAYLHTAGTSKTLANRLAYNIWGSNRWATNPGDAGFAAYRQAYTTPQVAVQVSGYRTDGLMFDEMGGGSDSGIVCLEYATKALYRTAMNTLLGSHMAWVPAGYNYPNVANYLATEDAAQAHGAGGGLLEFTNDCYSTIGYTSWTFIEARLAEGDQIMMVPQRQGYLKNTPRDDYPTFNAGNYGSVGQRLLMAEYANYLMVIDTAKIDQLSIDFYLTGSADPAYPHSIAWLAAFQTDLGAPTGARSTLATGTDGVGQDYTVFQRVFDNALVVFRPKTNWEHSLFGDTSAATVNLPAGTWKMLQADGTLGGTITTVSLRLAEAVILMEG